ncbi:MAG: 2-dehydropantoate 2-reductase [Solirubrobacteraceae bacterium]|nr:2-dehydropantoate 2-reductase [Solirubrobacteraceae bacterium]
MKLAVVGSGAIGTWLGAALARAGHDVALIARGAHLEAMRSGGVRVEPSEGEAYVVRPLVTGDAAEVGPVDAVLLCVKAHDQAGAGRSYAGPLLGPDTVVVAAQNGIPWWYFADRRVEAVDPSGEVSAVWPKERAIGCVVYLGASVPQPGTVHTHPEHGLVLGEPDGSDSPRLRAVVTALESAGFPVRVSPAIRAEIWTKLMGNATFNPASLITRAGLATMVGHPGLQPIIRAGMEEVVAIATALDAAPPMTVDERMAITARLGDFKPSTLQDVEAGRRVELDALLGAVVELADHAGVPAPTLSMLYALADLQARSLGLR